MLKAACLVFKMEIILLFRRSQEWLYPLSFFMMVILFFPLAFTSDVDFLQTYIPGFVWIAALLASLLSVETLFLPEIEDGHLEQLLLSPLPLSLLILAKLLAQWLVTQLPIILLLPIVGWMFHQSAHSVGLLMLSLFVGTPILTMIGGLCVALTLGLRQQGVFLGLLIMPLAIPVLIFGVTIVQQAQAGFAFNGALAFLAGMTCLAILLLPSVIAAALRISLDD
ncbi:MAG: heme exporter protein CcmB [Gammaproteobacteria bacterium]